MSGHNVAPTAEDLARWQTDYAGQRPEYRSESDWHTACRLWDGNVLENEAHWGRVGWPAILAYRAESEARCAAQWARQRAKHWLRHGAAGFTPGFPRPSDDDLAAAAMELATVPPDPEPVSAVPLTEEELIAVALAAPRGRR